MIGKLITFAENRNIAIRRMEQALSETIIEGIKLIFHSTKNHGR